MRLGLGLVGMAGLIAIGLWLDARVALSENVLQIVFYSSSLVGVGFALVSLLAGLRTRWQQVLVVCLAYLVWRVAYFPVLVLAGYAAGWWEALHLHWIGSSSIYPAFLVAMAVLNAWAMGVAGWILLRLLRVKPLQLGWANGLALFSSSLLGMLAVTVAFSHPLDWHSIPDTSAIDDKPLPSPALPMMNPYETAAQETGLNWRQRTLFTAAALTYDLVPENTQWSRVVKGTMEQEFMGTSDTTTAFCTKIHYRAFRAAQPLVNGQQRIVDGVLEAVIH